MRLRVLQRAAPRTSTSRHARPKQIFTTRAAAPPAVAHAVRRSACAGHATRCVVLAGTDCSGAAAGGAAAGAGGRAAAGGAVLGASAAGAGAGVDAGFRDHPPSLAAAGGGGGCGAGNAAPSASESEASDADALLTSEVGGDAGFTVGAGTGARKPPPRPKLAPPKVRAGAAGRAAPTVCAFCAGAAASSASLSVAELSDALSSALDSSTGESACSSKVNSGRRKREATAPHAPSRMPCGHVPDPLQSQRTPPQAPPPAAFWPAWTKATRPGLER
jgi:hypothetical protein